MKFNLTVNSQTQDGFKLTVGADNPEELNVVQDLTSKLIEKITKIEVTVSNAEEY